MVKKVQQDHPTCQHPDSSRAYLVLGHDGWATRTGAKENNRGCPGAAPHSALVWDQHHQHWPPCIMWTYSLGSANSLCVKFINTFSYYVEQIVNRMSGLAGRVLFKANSQDGTINPHYVRDAKSRNITPVWWKLGRQEWNKTPGKRLNLPPFTKCIDALIK